MEFHKLVLDNFPHEQGNMSTFWHGGYNLGTREDKGTVFISEEKSRLREQGCLVVSSDCTFGGRWLPVLHSVFLFGWVDKEHFLYPGISMWPERNSTHRQTSGGSPSSAIHCLLTLTRSFIASWASVSPLVGWKWPHSFWVTLLLSSLWLGSLCLLQVDKTCAGRAACQRPAATVAPSEQPVD